MTEPMTYIGAPRAAIEVSRRAEADLAVQTADGAPEAKNRRDVITLVKHVKIKNFILGGNFAFSTKTNDPRNARFYIFQIQSNGSYKLVQ